MKDIKKKIQKNRINRNTITSTTPNGKKITFKILTKREIKKSRSGVYDYMF